MVEERRRRLSFRLRTLMIAVTILAVWLGWNGYQLRQRAAMEHFIVSQGGSVNVGPPSRPWKGLPLAWRLLGAKSVSSIVLGGGGFTADDRVHIEPYFPEAEISAPASGGGGMGMGMM